MGATAEGIRQLSSAIESSRGGEKAAALRVAEQWVGAWKDMARQSNTIVVPANPGDASAMVGTAMAIFKNSSSGFGGGTDSSMLPPADGRTSSFGVESPPPLDEDEPSGDDGDKAHRS